MLNFGLSPRCPRIVWRHWGEIWAIFCHICRGRVDRVWLARETFIEILCRGWELNPGYEDDRKWETFIPPLRRGQSETHSFSHWAIMTWALERADSEIDSFSYWAIMTWALETTDSEMHSFSHWAIMTWALERADSEIDSFSYWAIMTDHWAGLLRVTIGCNAHTPSFIFPFYAQD